MQLLTDLILREKILLVELQLNPLQLGKETLQNANVVFIANQIINLK